MSNESQDETAKTFRPKKAVAVVFGCLFIATAFVLIWLGQILRPSDRDAMSGMTRILFTAIPVRPFCWAVSVVFLVLGFRIGRRAYSAEPTIVIEKESLTLPGGVSRVWSQVKSVTVTKDEHLSIELVDEGQGPDPHKLSWFRRWLPTSDRNRIVMSAFDLGADPKDVAALIERRMKPREVASTGRYDGPCFDASEENVVSIWAATVPREEIPHDYWQVEYDAADDAPWNTFANDFGFGSYDEDFVESYCSDDRKLTPLGELLAPLSYSDSFSAAAVERAQQVQIDRTSFVYLIYKFKYDPQLTSIERSTYFQFLGAFPFQD